jgi:hypothetical protein
MSKNYAIIESFAAHNAVLFRKSKQGNEEVFDESI